MELDRTGQGDRTGKVGREIGERWGKEGKEGGEGRRTAATKQDSKCDNSTSDIFNDGTLLAWTHIKNNFVTQTGPCKKITIG